MTLAKRLQQNVTSGTAGTSQLNVDNRNRITGAPANCTAANAHCYDAAGDLLNDGFHQYTYDAESRIKQVDGGAATYTYDADGQRVRKDSPSGSTDYVYFGGSIIAEKLSPTATGAIMSLPAASASSRRIHSRMRSL